MRQIFGCIAMLVALGLAFGAQPAKAATKTPSTKKTTGKTARKSTVARKTTGSRKATARRGSVSRSGRSTTVSRNKKRPVKRAATWRTRQIAPTPARYREIQEALVAKGYLQPGDATGVWGQSSVDALKRFQTEQNIESNGKINSLSLIALGLGPKHDTAAKPAPPQVPPAGPDSGRL